MVDINFTGQSGGIDDWIHANSIDYNEELDQIVISSPFLNELWIIDHSTTIAESASNTGGDANRGGDILYRWGNTNSYKGAGNGISHLQGQHHISWVEGSTDHKLIMFNNNAGADFSSVVMIKPPLKNDKTYELNSDISFGPDEPDFVFTMEPKQAMHSRIMSGVELLPNGNLLICSSLQGTIWEITPQNEVAWEYCIPVSSDGIVGRDFVPVNGEYASDPVFRFSKYSISFPAFTGRGLEPQEPIEGRPWFDCSLITSIVPEVDFRNIYPNPARDFLYVSVPTKEPMDATVINALGLTIHRQSYNPHFPIDVSTLVPGIYFLKIGTSLIRFVKQ